MARPRALITGGTKRIGAAIAQHFAAQGYDLALHSRRPSQQDDEISAMLRSTGVQVSLVHGELSDLGCLPAIIEEASRTAPLQVLVNNAASFDVDSFGDLDPEQVSRTLAVVLEAPVLLAQAFAKAARTSGAFAPGEAAIVNLIDQRVFRPNPQAFSYTLAKSALLTATRTMAQALAPHIRVNGVGPGPTLANSHDGSEGFVKEAAGTLLQRSVSPEEIAQAVHFLAEARSITGQMIAVDSGQHLGWRTPDIVD